MDAFVIRGGARLSGEITVNGSKNAALPAMSAALLTDEPVVLRGVPRLADTRSMLGLLRLLGVNVQDDAPHEPDLSRRSLDRTVTLSADPRGSCHAPYDMVRTMRASICVLGPLLARRGEARVSMPGGCAIGDRPVDLHLRGLAEMGAEIRLDEGDIVARAPQGRLSGARIFLGGPFGSTVLGTANIMCAATLATGRTVIEAAACEPEVVDLANLLTTMGARISGAGGPRIVIDGVDQLGGASHDVMPDRIEAGTIMMAAAITNGRIILRNCPLDASMSVVDRLRRVGVDVEPLDAGAFERDPMRAACEVSSRRTLSPVHVTTQPHPGFPTDLQAQLMALLCLADGNSVVTEKIYPERFLHVAELSRMGARLFRQGPTVVVSGVRRLVGAPVMASDLRASACLALAGMSAEGVTTIRRVYHIDRGYEQLERVLGAVGADIKRVDDRELDDAETGAAPAQPAVSGSTAY